ncbi:MAG: hypothetical protein FWE69_02980 [Clostridiales bacterium]|nr:hypothetical protein [Clostridiales bacterium]
MKKRNEQTRLYERAQALFLEFKNAYAQEWQRLDACERMYRGEHWYDVPQSDPNEPRPVTPIIQATVENLAADLMDREPEAVITPEVGAEARVAQVVEAVIARNHDSAGYTVEYQKLVHDLLVGGYCVQEVGYDGELNNNLGGAFIRQVDTRAILFDPLCTDIQEGRAVFKISRRSREWLAMHYPKAAAGMVGDTSGATDAPQDEILRADTRDCLLLLEYWWREYDAETRTHAVHMALLCGGQVLHDSRTSKPEGYFEHGLYPFVLTPLYARKGTCLGFGVVDLFSTTQQYADKLDQIVLKNAFMASHNKLLVTEAAGFDTDDLKDWSREVHRGESLSGITWFTTPPLPAYLLAYIKEMRESIKNESGASEASRGVYSANVTAASAITALQEANTKRTRMASTQLYEGFAKAVRLEIEVEREFNFFARPITIVVDGVREETVFDSALLIKEGYGGALLPIEFYISVKATKQSRFTAAAQNELILQLVQIGALQAGDAVELMHFDGKELVLKKIREQMNAGQELPLPEEGNRRSRQGGAAPATTKRRFGGRNVV